MQNFSFHVPIYVVDGGVATTGHSGDLTAKKLGLFNRSNFNVSTAGSTEKELFFAQGANGGKSWYGYTITQNSHKSPYFLASDVEDIYVSLPVTPRNEEWILGYNGSPSSTGIRFVKGQPTKVKFLFTGEPVYRFFGGPKEYLVSYTPYLGCENPCEDGDCTNNVVDDPILEVKKLVDEINNDTELRKFGVKAYPVWDGYLDEGTGGTNTATKKFRITLKRKADGSDRTADIQTQLAGLEGVVKSGGTVTVTKTAGAGSGTEGISDDYVITLTSYEEADVDKGLSSNVTFRYADIPAIEGASWYDVVNSETDPATVDFVNTPVSGRKVGIRVTAGYIDPKFGNCSFNPWEYYEMEPIRFEVSLLNEAEGRCDVQFWPSQLRTQEGRIGRQSGEWVIREKWLKDAAYLKHMQSLSLDPREREAFDQRVLDTVDRTAYYKLFYVRYKASYGHSYRKNEQERFTTMFAVKVGDSTNETALDTNIISVLETRSGKTRHINT